MKLRSPLMALMLVVVALYGSGCNSHSVAETDEDSAAAGGAALDRVTAAAPQRTSLTLSTAQPGRLEAFQEAPLYAKVSGYIAEVHVDIGDAVTKDQVLIDLWVPELQDDLRQKEAMEARAAAEVEQAAAAVLAAEAAVKSAEARVAQAQAGIARVEADLQFHALQSERLRNLAANGSVEDRLAEEAQSQWQSASAAVGEAQANVASAEAALAEARAQVVQAQADQSASEAQFRVAEADRQRAATMSGYTQIKAPFAGVITHRGIDAGHYVHPPSVGTTPALLVVTQTDRVRLFVDVPEIEAAFVDVGDEVTLRIPALAGQDITAQRSGHPEPPPTVTRTSWSLDMSNRSLLVEIDIPNPEGRLRPGMFATASIRLEERSDVLVLPATAIDFDGHEAACWCVESGTVTRRPIHIGLHVGDQVEVVSGVDEEALVVQRGIDSLNEGQAVDAVAPE